jgi:peptidoglycan/xylan/chitin deacetylase (PgdA/CDA1 family)
MTIKAKLRNDTARLLFLSGLTHPQQRAQGRLSIVTFHRVLPAAEREAYPYPGLVVTPEELGDLLTYFTRHFDCGTLATQQERYLGDGGSNCSLLAITFDDGQYDNLLHARPVLAHFGVQASFFVPVTAVESQTPLWHDRLGFAVLGLSRQGDDGVKRLQGILAAAGLSGHGTGSLVDNVAQESKGLELEARLRLVDAIAEASGNDRIPKFARMMSFGELAELASDGHEIGSHSMTHCLMPECDDQALEYEVAESRRLLQTKLGRPIESFCYPNGNSDARSAAAVAKAGYRRAVTTTWGLNDGTADRFRLRRCDMDAGRMCDANGKLMPAVLAFRMSGLYPGLK